MHHTFDIEIAKEYGVNPAIFLNNIAHWIKKNQANEKHFYEGRYWTYNSSEAFSELFPYWSTDQIDRLIKKCVSIGLLLISNFNETTYDRTRWYGLTDFALSLFNIPIPRNRGMDSAKSNLPFREIAEPIPYINTDVIQKKKDKSICAIDIAQPKSKPSSFDRSPQKPEALTEKQADPPKPALQLVASQGNFEKFWDIYPRKKDRKRAQEIWRRRRYDEIADLIMNDIAQRLLNDAQWKTAQYIPYPTNYLKGERWEDEVELMRIKPSVNKETPTERAMRMCLA